MHLSRMREGRRGRLRLDMQIFWQGNAKNCMFIHLSNCVVLVAVAFWLMRAGRSGFCRSWSAWCASMPGLKLINGNDNSTRSSSKDKAWPGPACMQSCNATRLGKKAKTKTKQERTPGFLLHTLRSLLTEIVNSGWLIHTRTYKIIFDVVGKTRSSLKANVYINCNYNRAKGFLMDEIKMCK